MGHTVSSQRVILDIIIEELNDYGKALGVKDREVFNGLLKGAYKHYGAMTYASSIHVWAFILLSIILELEKKRIGEKR